MLKAKIINYSPYHEAITNAKKNIGKACFTKENTIKTYFLPHVFLSDLFDDKKLQCWIDNPQIIPFLDSQTSSGKTTLIIEKLFPILKKTGNRLCYLVPRTSLCDHVKKEFAENDYDAKKIYENLSDKGQQHEKNYGYVDILTYQSVLSLTPDEIKTYGAVILDECHYFTSDAAFNRYTSLELDFILKNFQNICKIFITATPYEIFDPLYKCLREIYNQRFQISLYHFERDYSYIVPYFFQNEDDINKLILQSSPDQKWIIFIDNKQKGEKLKVFFEKNNFTSSYLDADSKQDERASEVKDLINNENFPCQVIIFTSAFDVGINIKTKEKTSLETELSSNYTSIVIYSYNRVELLQEIGRKRLKNNECVNIYFHIPTKLKISGRKTAIQNLLNNALHYEADTTMSNFLGHDLPMPFFIHNYEIAHNPFTYLRWTHDLSLYDGILAEISAANFNTSYMKRILTWLDWNDSDITLYLESEFPSEDTTLQRILEVVRQYNSKPLSQDDFKCFSESISNIHNPRKDNRDARGNIGVVTLNKILSPLGYRISKDKKQPFYNIQKILGGIHNG